MSNLVNTFSVLKAEIDETMVFCMDAKLNKGTVRYIRREKSNVPNEIVITSRNNDSIHISDIEAIKGLREVLDRVITSYEHNSK